MTHKEQIEEMERMEIRNGCFEIIAWLIGIVFTGLIAAYCVANNIF